MHKGIQMRVLKILFLIVSINAVVGPKVLAQFDGRYSQYMFVKTFYNPAAVGEQQLMKVLAAQRLDWIGIKNAPRTTLFTRMECEKTR